MLVHFKFHDLPKTGQFVEDKNCKILQIQKEIKVIAPQEKIFLKNERDRKKRISLYGWFKREINNFVIYERESSVAAENRNVFLAAKIEVEYAPDECKEWYAWEGVFIGVK
ncbi:MAG: hypothetical protein N4A44_04325 [Alphaproteobacteria bacterium]|jgi:hypothetical protein|nr:hypothetical protein [Alphaproteobacteria bacterium]